MTENNTFSESEMEAFKELGNVGAGHAAIALAKLFRKEVDMSVPFIITGTADEILNEMKLDKDVIVGFTTTEVKEPLRYRLSVIFKNSVISALLELLSSTTRDDIKNESDLSDMQKSLVQEVGSTIILRYVAALNKMLKVEAMPDHAPKFNLFSGLDAVRLSGYSDTRKLIFIQLDLFTDNFKFECHLLIQPHPDSQEGYKKAFFL